MGNFNPFRNSVIMDKEKMNINFIAIEKLENELTSVLTKNMSFPPPMG